MRDQLDRDLRRHTEAFFEGLQPVEDLLPSEMADQFGVRQSPTASGTFAAPVRVVRRRGGWRVAVLAALAVLVTSVPAILFFTGPGSQLAEPDLPGTVAPGALVPGASVSIDGDGTFPSIEAQELLEFSVALSGGQPLSDGSLPAIGSIELSSSSAVIPTWSIKGVVVCVRPLSESVEGQPGEGVWEVRYSVATSNRPGVSEGQYASIYLRDQPGADAAGETITNPPNESACRPRPGIRLSALTAGRIEVRSR